MAGLLLAVVGQLAPFNLSPPRPPISDPMFAASPIRELRRAWDDCTWAITQTMMMNGRSEADADQWGLQMCADQESKLTGALVRRYGFTRGNEAINRAKAQFRAQISKLYAQQNNEQRKQAKDILATADDWALKKTDKGCVALSAEQDFLGNTSSVVGLSSLGDKAPGKYLIIFLFATKFTQQNVVSGGYPLQAKLSIALVRVVGSGSVRVGPFEAALGSGSKDGQPVTELVAVVDEASIRRLSGHEALSIQPVDARLAFPPFEIGDLGGAADLLKRCP